MAKDHHGNLELSWFVTTIKLSWMMKSCCMVTAAPITATLLQGRFYIPVITESIVCIVCIATDVLCTGCCVTIRPDLSSAACLCARAWWKYYSARAKCTGIVPCTCTRHCEKCTALELSVTSTSGVKWLRVGISMWTICLPRDLAPFLINYRRPFESSANQLRAVSFISQSDSNCQLYQPIK